MKIKYMINSSMDGEDSNLKSYSGNISTSAV